jgi:hypothetical protein
MRFGPSVGKINLHITTHPVSGTEISSRYIFSFLEGIYFLATFKMATLPSSSATPNTSNKSPRKPTCAVALDVNLEELKRLQGLESLRPYVVKEKCFPASVIPSANTP